MKAILVIDEMPIKCHDCQLMTTNMYCKGFEPYYTKEGAHITRRCVEDYVMLGTKHPNCPLKPMPTKMKADYDTIATCEVTEKVVAIGWNACVEAILGEEE